MNNRLGETMNKTELVKAIASGSGVTAADANRVLDMFMTTVTEVLSRGDQVVIPGFGSFSVSSRSARKGRNPRTGAQIEIKARKVARFTAGKSLKEAVQEA